MADNVYQLCIKHNQVGMAVEARKSRDEPWQLIDIYKYKVRMSTSVRQYSTCIDPKRDESEYLASLKERGIEYELFDSQSAQYGTVQCAD